MPTTFEKHAMKGNEFLHKLARNLGDEKDRERAGRILRSVLRALRNVITAEESIQLLAQLPVAIKGVYVDGWKFGHSRPRIRTIEDFAAEVIHEQGVSAWRDFANEVEVFDAIRAVMETLSEYVSEGEFSDIIAVLPKDIGETVNFGIFR